MASHNCRSKWDPANKAEVLTAKLAGLTVLHLKGWGRDLSDQVVYTSLVTLKAKLEDARGVMSSPMGNFRLGSISDETLKPDADSITGGLLSHVTDSAHTNAMNPAGQFGWITKVDPETPFTVFDKLMKAVRDCLDNPPGGGKGLAANASQGKTPSKGRPGSRPRRGN